MSGSMPDGATTTTGITSGNQPRAGDVTGTQTTIGETTMRGLLGIGAAIAHVLAGSAGGKSVHFINPAMRGLNTPWLDGYSRSRGKGGKRAHCVNSGVRTAQRAAIKRRNRARNKAHH